jgi:HPr kinase/phosphorylase
MSTSEPGESIILPGVFMQVMGMGVLITGQSGVGKSELALELLTRGHALVADDAPEFSRTGDDSIHGRCPEVLRDFLEVRGLGVLNVRAMFGIQAVLQTKRLHLIITLEPMSAERISNLDRLRGERRRRPVLGVEIPETTLPVAPGRNLAVLVEAAARDHLLHRKGYDAAEDFIQRQMQQIGHPRDDTD